MCGGAVRELSTPVRNVVSVSQMKIAADDECGSRQLAGKRICRIDAEHEIRRKVRTPRPRVVEVVFGVERVVSDEAAEDAALNGQSLTHWQQVGDIGRAQVSQAPI